MIPSIFSSPVHIASHQIKQAQAQGQSSSSQTGSSSSQSQQTQTSTSSKVVDATTDHIHTTSAETNMPVNAESVHHSDPELYSPTTAEGVSAGFSLGSLGEGYGSGVGENGRSGSSFYHSQQQQSFPSGNQQQQQQQATTMGQQQMYLNTPELQQGRHSQPPPNLSPYVEPRPQDDTRRSNSH
ncbi:hypothetical protein IQ06DRAFT_360579 [Phaeosphaeriaceae sp. SRC1lsM3a]|nr:hypothetical protein IQ06DRAFT_360579 [Stagonospora sp. SRC1lsM3a]